MTEGGRDGTCDLGTRKSPQSVWSRDGGFLCSQMLRVRVMETGQEGSLDRSMGH
jgi:hypothetical protein